MGKVIDLPVRPVKSCAGNPLEVTGSLDLDENLDGLGRYKASSSSNPGGDITLLDVNIPNGISRRILRIKVACGHQGTWKLLIDDVLETAGRVGAGDPESREPWKKGMILSNEENVKLIFEANQGPSSPVDAYIEYQDISP